MSKVLQGLFLDKSTVFQYKSVDTVVYVSQIKLIHKLPVSIYSIKTQKHPLLWSPHDSAHTLVLIASITLMTFIMTS